MPTVFRRAPMSCSSLAASTLATTADMPRSMLIPWSPSPIAASSWVSCSLFAPTSAAKARIQRTTSSWPRLMRPDAFSLSATSTILCLCRPSETGGLDRRVPETGQLVVKLQQRDRAARHLQRRDVGTDQVAGDRDPTLAQEPVQVVVDDVALDQRRAAHAVDEREDLVALLERQVLDDRDGEFLDDLGRGCKLHPLAAGLTVNADPDLHLVVAELEGRLAGRGNDARGQRHAHAASVGVDLSAQLRHLGEVAPLLGGRPADLLGQHRGADAAPPCGVEAVLHGDVVVDHHGFDLDALASGELGGHLEVHHVTRVVLDDVKDAGAAVDGLGRVEHLVGGRRREHLAGAGGVEHSGPDETAVHRLVPRAAARDQPDLALHRGVGANDHVRVELDAYEVWMGRGDAVQGLGDNVLWLVDQLLHVSSAPVGSLLLRPLLGDLALHLDVRGGRLTSGPQPLLDEDVVDHRPDDSANYASHDGNPPVPVDVAVVAGERHPVPAGEVREEPRPEVARRIDRIA